MPLKNPVRLCCVPTSAGARQGASADAGPYLSPESHVFVKKLAINLVALTSLAVSVGSLGAAVTAPGTAGASTPSVSVLVPVSDANSAGFTKVVNAPTSSTATGVSGCPDGAQEEFSNASGNLGLASEVLNGKRALSKTLIGKLARRFRVEPALFLD